ncbi:MAG: response regulator transcription factor [Kordiimonadaceae bacterium]|nr:response regulator transcription factor [Kordiimonadaceae bacterium]
MERTRVMLADDHLLLVEAFEKILEPEFKVVGNASDGRELVERTMELRPDVVVLDISMPSLNGLVACEQIKKMAPKIKTVFLTVNESAEIVSEAFKVGADGYLLKKSAASELIEAIKQVSKGFFYITPLVARSMVDNFVHHPKTLAEHVGLTARQKEVLQLLVEGYSMKEAARLLGISPRTVAFHKYRVMENQHLKTNADLIQFALKKGIISE